MSSFGKLVLTHLLTYLSFVCLCLSLSLSLSASLSLSLSLCRLYPNHTFHYLNQRRYEYIHTGTAKEKQAIDFVNDFLFSMSNLYISVEADLFVGTLTSSWCSMIHALQRTRGDGGRDYHTVDKGSAYTVCY
jgi:hypothetical protein